MYTVKDFKEAGTTPYLDNDQSPKRYFLIATQLPFFVGSALKHKEDLGLDAETASALKALLPKYKPSVVHNATAIKIREQEAIAKLVDQKATPAEVDPIFVEIADMQLAMQRRHAECVRDVQDILSDSQYKALVEILKRGVEDDGSF